MESPSFGSVSNYAGGARSSEPRSSRPYEHIARQAKAEKKAAEQAKDAERNAAEQRAKERREAMFTKFDNVAFAARLRLANAKDTSFLAHHFSRVSAANQDRIIAKVGRLRDRNKPVYVGYDRYSYAPLYDGYEWVNRRLGVLHTLAKENLSEAQKMQLWRAADQGRFAEENRNFLLQVE